MSKPIVRFNKTHAVILCPLGHLIASCSNDTLAGSRFQAEANAASRGEPSLWDEEASRCDGAGHVETGAAERAKSAA